MCGTQCATPWLTRFGRRLGCIACTPLAAIFGCLAPTTTDVPTQSRTFVVNPPTASVPVGDTLHLTAVLTDATGRVLDLPAATWTSSAPGVAQVDQAGLVRSVAAGTATITAALANGTRGSAVITVPLARDPGTVSDLAVAAVTDTSVVLSFTEVGDGNGQPARYDVRFAPGTTLTWGGDAASVGRGSCATPVAGTGIGAKRTCTVLDLASSTTYSFQLVAFRGTLNVNAAFGDLSNVATGTTAASTAPVTSVTVDPPQVTLLVGATRQLRAVLRDARGRVLPNRTVAWTSTAPAAATVDDSGLVMGVALGSATIIATSEGHSDSASVDVVATLPPVTYYSTNFNDGTTGPLDVYSYGGGGCVKSTDYRDSTSAYSMKCTIPSGTGAAALQAWFGTGSLAGLPSDPSLDQDLFQEVRFVLAPGATQAIGGPCTPAGWKVHKSVYGQAGNAWNGWVMSMESCGNGTAALVSEAEMWTIDGKEYRWPGTTTSFNEGKVYDVIYRYHRYTSQKCGTIAVWVNGVNVMDSPCWSYIGATNGSTQGLLFWDGATYLQDGLGPFTVYTLFTQATNYPIGAATR